MSPRAAGGTSSLGLVLVIVLAGCLALTHASQDPPSSTPANPVQQLRDAIETAVRGPGVSRAVWGIVVHSLSADERLFDLNPGALLVPGSVSKLVSVATGVDAVGWDYQFETTIRATGPIVGGTLQGDLLVVGSGDPSIGGRGGDNLSVLIDALKGLGITAIDGRIIGDDDDIEEPRPQLAWSWDDLGYTSGAIFGALNLGENVMVATVVPGAAAGDATTLSVEPTAIDRPLINRSVTGPRGSQQLLWPEQRPGEVALTVTGTIPVGAAPARVQVAVGNPTLWFASVLRRRLQLEGIAVNGGAFDLDEATPKPDRQTSTLLYAYRSRPLAAIVQPLLKDSINVYGEAFLRLNAPGDGPRTNDAALRSMARRLEAWGLTPDEQQIVDGSGLSRRNVVSSETLLRVLRQMHDPTGTSPFMTALSVAGVDGSLRNRMKMTPAEGTVRAKTGTMSNIRSLAGYTTTTEGETLAFTIMVNNFEGPGTAAVDAIDAIAVAIARFQRQAPAN